MAFTFLFVYLFAFLLCLLIFGQWYSQPLEAGTTVGKGRLGPVCQGRELWGPRLCSRFSCFRRVRVSVQLFWVPKFISGGEAKLGLGVNLSLDEFIFGCWVYYFCSQKRKKKKEVQLPILVY